MSQCNGVSFTFCTIKTATYTLNAIDMVIVFFCTLLFLYILIADVVVQRLFNQNYMIYSEINGLSIFRS